MGKKRKLTSWIPLETHILQVIKPHDTRNTNKAPQQKQPAHPNLLAPVKMQTPYNGYRHGQNQDIRQHIGDIVESKKGRCIDAVASGNSTIPEKRNGRALESDAKALNDADHYTGDAECHVAGAPSGSCIFAGEKTAVEEENGEFDEDHCGRHEELECVCELGAKRRDQQDIISTVGFGLTWT